MPIGRQIVDQLAGNEGDHFMQCEYCGEVFDCQNLGEVLVHEGHAHALLQRKRAREQGTICAPCD
jgi:uncharacterized C2H2 Zn-finger protein